MHRMGGAEIADILVAHGTFYDRRSSAVYVELGEDARYMPIYPWDVAGKARYVALGHYHSRYASFAAGTTQIVYPGSPVATSARCTGPRHISVITFEGDDVRHHEEPVVIADYWEQGEWIVVPGREEQLFALLEENLDQLAGSRVMLYGRVIGSVRLSEVEFASRLKTLEEKHRARYKSLRIVSQARYWDELLRSPTLRLFGQRLVDMNTDDLTRERALELVLAALERIRT
jgi:DNA repair exonuclease SbcCD nuclease subunit